MLVTLLVIGISFITIGYFVGDGSSNDEPSSKNVPVFNSRTSVRLTKMGSPVDRYVFKKRRQYKNVEDLPAYIDKKLRWEEQLKRLEYALSKKGQLDRAISNSAERGFSYSSSQEIWNLHEKLKRVPDENILLSDKEAEEYRWR